jgi:hypothetical protein
MTSSRTPRSTTPWHDEGGKLHLCESLVSRFNHYLACADCMKHLADRAPLSPQPNQAFVKNSGGSAPPGTVRRVWSCRVARSPNRIFSCRNLGVSSMLELCFTQLTVEQFDQSVRDVTSLYDIRSAPNAPLKSWVIKHRQRLGRPLSPSPPPATPIHVQPAKVDLWDADEVLATKRKAASPTGSTPSRDDRHRRNLEKANDVFVDAPLSPTRLPVYTKPASMLESGLQEAATLHTKITQCIQQLSEYHEQLGPVLRHIKSLTEDSTQNTPATSVRSPTASPTLPPSPPPPTSSMASAATMAFAPPRKGKNRKPIEITWIYAGCLLPEPEHMSPKERHDAIIQEAAMVYGQEDLDRIIWARQLDDDDWTVELTVYKADVDRLLGTWAARFRDDSILLNLHDRLRDLHNPRYWTTFVAHTPNPDNLEARTLIRQHDICELAQAWVGCQSKMVKTYLRRLSEEWKEQDLFYREVGACRDALGTKFPDAS